MAKTLTWFADIKSQPATPGNAHVDLASQIDQLIATGKPADAFAAYGLVADCLYFQKWGTLPFIGFPGPIRDMTEEEAQAQSTLCEGMTERIKTSRLEHLKIAAEAGVMGADSAFLNQGPFGDPSALLSRPDDPLVQAWKQQAIAYLTTQANNADQGSLTTLFYEYSVGSDVVAKNPTLALTYALALRKLNDQTEGLRDWPMQYSDSRLQGLEAGMSASQIDQAEAQANKILAASQKKRNR